MGADLVFEASGSRTAVPQGLGLLRNRGTYLIPGQYSNSGGVEIEPQLITFRALRLIGSSQYSLRDVGLYLQFLQSHAHLRPVIDALITAYPVEKVNEAFADMKAGTILKPSCSLMCCLFPSWQKRPALRSGTLFNRTDSVVWPP